MKIRTALLAAVLVAANSVAIAEETRHSRDEESACRSDSRRFCRRIDPDTGTQGILMCLKQNRAKLSRACRNLLESHGQ